MTTGEVAFLYTLDGVNRPNALQVGAPVELFQSISALEANEKVLLSTGAADEKGLAILQQLLARLKGTRLALNRVKRSIDLAQSANGWTVDAGNEFKASYADFDTSRQVPSKELTDMLADAKYLDTLPRDLSNNILLRSDGTGFTLQIYTWPKKPLRLARVKPDGFAEKLGLKVDDDLIELNGKAIVDITDFKKTIKANLGRKLKLLIRRYGKDLEINIKIPKEIPKTALVPGL